MTFHSDPYQTWIENEADEQRREEQRERIERFLPPPAEGDTDAVESTE